MNEFFLRFMVGGAVVCVFAALGDVLKPKSFAGLFAAAPSIAMATLAITIAKRGGEYASMEGVTMIAGAVALNCYCGLTSWLLMRKRWHALPASLWALILWLAVSVSFWFMLSRMGVT